MNRQSEGSKGFWNMCLNIREEFNDIVINIIAASRYLNNQFVLSLDGQQRDAIMKTDPDNSKRVQAYSVADSIISNWPDVVFNLHERSKILCLQIEHISTADKTLTLLGIELVNGKYSDAVTNGIVLAKNSVSFNFVNFRAYELYVDLNLADSKICIVKYDQYPRLLN